MKIIAYFLFASLMLPASKWQYDFNEAQKTAIASNRHILLYFSGSDWCGPCIRLRKEIFDSEIFQAFADSSLVLVNADFPRSLKNKQDKQQVKQNDLLADRYNPKGKFPYTLLLDARGNIIKDWEGFPQISPSAFVNQVKAKL